MYKSKMLMVLVLGLVISIAGLNGCAKKKKITPTVEQKKEAPVPKPAPPAVVPKAPEKKEEGVPRDLSFQTIYFDFDKSNIRSDQRVTLERNAQLLSKRQTVKIRIEGHCDERGTDEYNMALGQRRADSVQSFFSDYGISSFRVSTVTYGEMRPADSGHDETAWAKNRRCEIIITGR